jgi:hypothetical protein
MADLLPSSPMEMPMHTASSDDVRFREEFEACGVPPEHFDHGAHVRLAYAYLAEHDTDTALGLFRGCLMAFIRHNGIDPSKYHETITQAWILAVRHFMEHCAPCRSAAEFVASNPALLNSRIMLAHYSAEVLFSAEARRRFVGPDLAPIPRHGS